MKTNTNFHSEYLSGLLNSIDASVVASDKNFIIEYFNKGAEVIFECTSEEAIGKKSNSVLTFEYIDEGENSVRQALVTKGTWKGQLYHIKNNGEKLLLNVGVSSVKNKDGEVTGYVGVHRDITDYSKTKTDLQTLLSVFSSINDNFFIVTKDYQVIMVDEKSNDNIESYYGHRYEIGDHVLEKLPLNRKQQIENCLTAAFKGEKTIYETNIINKSGKSVWLQCSCFPIKDAHGMINLICLMGRNITTQKEVEQVNEKLYQSRKLFETFMENSPMLSWITDGRGTFHYLNPSYLKAFHLKKEQIGKSVFEIFPEPLASQAKENDDLVLQTNQPLKTISKAVTPDNKEHIYQVIKFPIHSDDTTYIGGWAIDITDEIILRETIKNNFEQLQQSEKDLKEALAKEHQLNDMKSRFVSMASHEFRTPLSTMLSSTFLLEKYTTTDQQTNRTKHTHKIKEAIHHMNSLLEDFLSLGKLDEGKTTVKPTHFNLGDLISDVIEEVEPIRKEGQAIHFNSNGCNEIYTDKKLLKNILVNLLSNAYKFSEENKSIWIGYKTCNKNVEISVTDEGIGISEEDKKHLFETFFRAKNAQNIQGTGLGLHIIKRYADLLNAGVDLKSEIGKGTTVTLTLPLN